MKGFAVVLITLNLVSETIDVVDGIIHRNADADGGDGDGHHVQGNIQPSHETQHAARGEQVGEKGDQGDFQRAEKNPEHHQQGQGNHAQGFDLGSEKEICLTDRLQSILVFNI